MASTNRMRRAQYKATLQQNLTAGMAQTTSSTEPMAAELAALLAEFARTCKAAARAVSLYPGTHPAIPSSLNRLVLASARLTNNARIVCGIRPDIITIAGRAPVRPDPAIGEL